MRQPNTTAQEKQNECVSRYMFVAGWLRAKLERDQKQEENHQGHTGIVPIKIQQVTR